ncbi:unnamed protein product [Medioppia subpectinata]|uniref:ABC transmembrane type-1 domain-containing protein n=1 Tax=Medioppia subpectinata TaxID=1979941 RepID=A0A7R9Q4R1_9ACAR|nr:unnamed protein product [Medioppia subpectinata]CAG2111973.1 unnamed protein product [Medioppia subpectinata]
MGLKKDIDVNDLGNCSESQHSEYILSKLERNWNNELKKTTPSFMRASLKTYFPYLLPPMLIQLIYSTIISPFSIVMIGRVIRYFSAPESEPNPMPYVTACLCAAGVVVSTLSHILISHPYCLMCYRAAVKVRVGWSALLYNKSLRLKTTAFEKTTIGQIVNLMTNDVSRFEEVNALSVAMGYVILVPFNGIIYLYISWQYIGSSGWCEPYRANATLAFCPPLKRTPLSPTIVLSLKGRESKSLSNAQTAITSRNRFSLYCFPNTIFCTTLALKTHDSCDT